MTGPEHSGDGKKKLTYKQLNSFIDAIKSMEEFMDDKAGVGIHEYNYPLNDGRIASLRIYDYDTEYNEDVGQAGPTYSFIIYEPIKVNDVNILVEKEFPVHTYADPELTSEDDVQINRFIQEENGEYRKIPDTSVQLLSEASKLSLEGKDEEAVEKYSQVRSMNQERNQAEDYDKPKAYEEAMEILREIQRAHGIKSE